MHERGRELSLLLGTPMEYSPPDALGFSRDGTRLFARGMNTRGAGFYLGMFEVGEALEPSELLLEAEDLIQPYLDAAPNAPEALALSQYQSLDGRVKDVIYRVGLNFPPEMENRSGIPYEGAPGLPEGDHDTFFTLKPFYSWDGESVVVPFNDAGLAIVAAQTGGSHYVPYPDYDTAITNSSFGALPDEADTRRIWASFWGYGTGGDHCEVYVLDLDAHQWVQVFNLPWVAYSVGVASVADAPWVVAGSYSNFDPATGQPLDAARGARLPRLARVMPVEGTTDLLPLGGEPVRQIALEGRGSHALYLDGRRNAIARLDLASGRLDLDKRWYSPDEEVRLFISSDGERCFAWRQDILIEASWEANETVQGYGRD